MKQNTIPEKRNARYKRRGRKPVSASGVYNQFLKELLSGAIEPGERLGEPTLAARWEVSRPPVRDALIRLECEGLVERRPKSGTYVRQFQREEVEELYDLRAMIEAFVVRKLVEVVTDEELDELEQLAIDADSADPTLMDAQEVIERESRFHLRLCELAQLPHTMRLLNMPHLLLSTFRLALTQRLPQSLPHHHRNLVRTLRTRDTKRCEACVIRDAEVSKQELLASMENS